jgi:protein-ribulosamine 3-kinase
MLEGEFVASSAIHAVMPSLIPKAYAWGRFCHPSSETYFILSDFVRFKPGLPDPDKLAVRLAELHRTSSSSNGMFGFSVPTCDGALPHRVAWKANWGDFYGELLRGVLEHDVAANGRWVELERMVDDVIEHVIPRLLGALQTGGRQLRPSLIHGDLYEGNMGTHDESGEIIVWDASSFYAHNEMELGLWRWNKVMHSFTESYLRHFKKSEPEHEWDDRNRLYSVKSKLNMSADHPGDDGKAIRQV